MDCFKTALEYLVKATLENNGLTGTVIVTKIEPDEGKGRATPTAADRAQKRA